MGDGVWSSLILGDSEVWWVKILLSTLTHWAGWWGLWIWAVGRNACSDWVASRLLYLRVYLAKSSFESVYNPLNQRRGKMCLYTLRKLCSSREPWFSCCFLRWELACSIRQTCGCMPGIVVPSFSTFSYDSRVREKDSALIAVLPRSSIFWCCLGLAQN